MVGKMNLQQQILMEAKKYLGTPYLYGGNSSKGVDNSGLIKSVYKSIGFNIGRTTYDQINQGIEVSKEELQPGDLVFFGTPDDPYHVGICVDKENFIEAPHTGSVVRISNLNDRNDFIAARRIIS